MTPAKRVFTFRTIKSFAGGASRRALYLIALASFSVFHASVHTEHYASKEALEVLSTVGIPTKTRAIYPFSVIYGGAYSSEELIRSRRLDSVVRAHYADFGANPAVQQTRKDLFMYVSYRQSDRVYWTKTKRHIPAGELVLTDGKNLARTRCGNRLSFVPQQPTVPEKEFPEEAFDTPEIPKMNVPLDAFPTPAVEADLYVPSAPLLDGLLPSSSPSMPVISGSVGTPESGGLAAGAPIFPAGSFAGGVPGFVAAGRPGTGNAALGGEAPVAGVGIPVAIPIAIPLATETPEPSTSGLLLTSLAVSAIFILKTRTCFRS